MNSDDIRDEYDFSHSKHGQFHRKDSVLSPPVRLDEHVLIFLTARAAQRRLSLNELVNALLKKSIELIEAAE